jgi:hypothetical protein
LISVQSGLLLALGFLIASLLGLLLASAFWSRAVRLTTQRLRDAMPVSESEIKADRDRLKAEHAVRVHKLNNQLEGAKLERARHLIEINRRDASISALEADVTAARAELEENTNARRVLEQTVADRLPKVEARLSEAKRLLFNRDREIAELTQGAKRHKLALEEASSISAQKTAEIDKLNDALSTRPRSRRGQARSDGTTEVSAELERLRLKVRDQATLIDRLQQRAGHGFAPVPSPATLSEAEPSETSSQGEGQSLRPEPAAASNEREMAALRAKAEDQAGEIARLKVALAAFEQGESGGLSFKNSKIALKARADSAEAQRERQTATINRLRAELAAAHERLARQGAHFAEEMRRLGAGPGLASSSDRGLRRGNLLDRVAHVRPVLPNPEEPRSKPVADRSEPTTSDANGNGHSTNGAKTGPENAGQGEEAAQMPQTEAIEERSKPRLRDRLIGLAKG